MQQPDAVSFLAARWLHEHRRKFRSPGYGFHRPTVGGLCADALASYGVGVSLRPDVNGYWPADRRALRACERTYAMAPDGVRALMLDVLEEYRAHVAGRGQA